MTTINKIPAEVQKKIDTLVEDLRPRLRVDGASIKEADDKVKLYDETLHVSGLDIDTATRVHDHDQIFQAGIKTAVGEMILDEFKKEGAPDQFTFMTAMGRNNYELVITRNEDDHVDILSRHTMVDTAGVIHNAYEGLRAKAKAVAKA